MPRCAATACCPAQLLLPQLLTNGGYRREHHAVACGVCVDGYTAVMTLLRFAALKATTECRRCFAGSRWTEALLGRVRTTGDACMSLMSDMVSSAREPRPSRESESACCMHTTQVCTFVSIVTPPQLSASLSVPIIDTDCSRSSETGRRPGRRSFAKRTLFDLKLANGDTQRRVVQVIESKDVTEVDDRLDVRRVIWLQVCCSQLGSYAHMCPGWTCLMTRPRPDPGLLSST